MKTRTMRRGWSRYIRTSAAGQTSVTPGGDQGFSDDQVAKGYLALLGMRCAQWSALGFAAKRAYVSQTFHRGFANRPTFEGAFASDAPPDVDGVVAMIDAYCARAGGLPAVASPLVQNYFGNTGAPFVKQYGIPTQSPFGIISPEQLGLRPAGQAALTPTQGAFALIAASVAFAFGAAYVGSKL